MKREGTYYVGRIIKLGQLDNDGIIRTLKNPTSIIIRSIGWTIIDVIVQPKFVFGFLSKYAPEGEITSLDLAQHSEVIQKQPNLIIAKSPFIYIPDYSGIAFLKISNQIEPSIFAKRFCRIIKETYENFFMDCQLEMITDLRSFSVKLSNLEGIYKIYAKINPPNPLFGPLWKSLKEYLEKRKTENMKVEETASKKEPIQTDLPQLIKTLAEGTSYNKTQKKEIPIGDAAVLMAADGYGKGTIKGKQGSNFVTIRTDQTIRNFGFSRDPKPQELYDRTVKIFISISEERHMKHDEKID